MANQIMTSGFLVVLEPRPSPNTGKLYAGVDRVPTYPSEIPGEERAMDAYLFGGLKDDSTNLIPSLRKAVRLCKMLRRGGRRFEIIHVQSAIHSVAGCPPEIEGEHLGYDVAGVSGDCWSIVLDFPVSDWALPYRERLNQYGLFVEGADARSYLEDYRAHNEPDADSPFDVVEVMRTTFE